jgi:hypothetical protein
MLEYYKMKKLILVLPLLLTACGDDEEKRIKQLEAQNNQARMQLEQQQQQMNMQQQFAQQNAQPQYIQPQMAPQAPVIVQQPQHDNTIMNMAVGALAGHAISNAMNSSNDRPSERVVERRTVVIDNRQPVAPSSNVQSNVAPSTNYGYFQQPKPATKSSMDMAKLSESAKYSPPSNNASVSKPFASRPSSSMNMSKLSSRR